ncbi:MAG: PrsW family glutamic-type intramembrane protease, partial [Coriobacteriia bacterium]|nr:PrsW family glutamic-type intramembrane protease [Coriobacteriia bacterium]
MEILLAIAVVPGLVLMGYVYAKDPVEKEPVGLLVKLFALGAASALLAGVIEIALDAPVRTALGYQSLAYLLAHNILVVALVEEGCKFLFLKKSTWRSSEFNYLFDGIVYAVFVSLGFAVLENVIYVFEYGFATGIARALTSMPGHAVFAVFMGSFYAKAKLADVRGDVAGRQRNLRLAVVMPVVAHGAYDVLASIGSDLSVALFLLLLVVLFGLGLRLVRRESKAATRLFSSSPLEPRGGVGAAGTASGA